MTEIESYVTIIINEEENLHAPKEKLFKERVCSVCREKETRAVDKLQHKELVIVTKPDAPIQYKTDFTLVASGTVTWSSSNEKVVKVDPATGKLTTVGKGTATITATSVDGKTAKCEITVQYAWWQVLIRILLLGFLWY